MARRLLAPRGAHVRRRMRPDLAHRRRAAPADRQRGNGITSLARRFLQAAIQLDPDRADAYLMLARAYDSQSTYPVAERYCREYLRRAPNPAPGHYLLAKIYAAQARRERAEQEIAEALRVDP